MPSNHVRHLLTAYVHRQLSRPERLRVLKHLQTCEACRAALAREDQVAHELQTFMPTLGLPPQGRLARLWPTIWAEFQAMPASLSLSARMPSFSMALIGMLLCALLTSVLLVGPTNATAAPLQALQAVPGDGSAASSTLTATVAVPSGNAPMRPTASATSESRANGPTIAPAPTTETLPTANGQ